MNSLDELFKETFARHFPEARVVGREVELGFGELVVSCSVNDVKPFGTERVASLFFRLRGGLLGPAPIFASISGYGSTDEQAVVSGACLWACSFGPVLRAGLGGPVAPDLEALRVTLDGQQFRLFLDGLDRALSTSGTPSLDLPKAARARLGGSPWLTPRIIKGGGVPALAVDRPTLLSTFVFDAPDHRVVEVKVDGVDWPAAGEVLAPAARAEEPGAVFLREFAVLVPDGDARALSADAVRRTLHGLTLLTDARRATSWRGWLRRRGELSPPLSTVELSRLEAWLVELPREYRSFLHEVGSFGAGPGYGLLPPNGQGQRELAAGTFSWEDGGPAPEGPPSGAIVLSHAGCGVVWLLALSGPSRGEVWIDSRSTDGQVRRVASSFDAWYRAWLEAAIRNQGPWVQWEDGCAAQNVYAQYIEAREAEGLASADAVLKLARDVRAGGLALNAAGSPYFITGAPLDPCERCWWLTRDLGVTTEAFRPGAAPVHETVDPSFGGTVFRRLFSKLFR